MNETDAGVFASRLETLREVMQEQNADVTILGLSSGMKYLTGFSDEPGERMLLLLVPRQGAPIMIVPTLYEEQVRAHRPLADIHAWDDGDVPEQILDRVARGLPFECRRILIDDTLWAAFVLPVMHAFAESTLLPASSAMASLRMAKDASELDAMRRAGEIADKALGLLMREPFNGRTERQIAVCLESAMLDEGADSIAFETLVASGPNSALPHHRAGSRVVATGDAVILDFGCRVDGYCSDISRTVVCGRATDEIRQAHAAVLEAHDRAISHVNIGCTAEEIDTVARASLGSAGLAAWFTHRTGHGVGLDIHEPPYIVQGDKTKLMSGMTFSVEPGVYFPTRFGVRVEDVVAVSDSEVIHMTEASRELFEVH